MKPSVKSPEVGLGLPRALLGGANKPNVETTLKLRGNTEATSGLTLVEGEGERPQKPFTRTQPASE
eukprot:1177701-Alexandrium_andersonii.AAC.1